MFFGSHLMSDADVPLGSRRGASFADRLQQALGTETPYAFAKRIELNDSTFRGYLAGKEPKRDLLVRFAQALEVQLDWLAAGRGEMRATSGQQVEPAIDDLSDGLVMVPRLDVQASAGGGLLPFSDQVVEYIAIPEFWLRAQGINPRFAQVLQAKGDSMSETIQDGDLLIVDTSINEIRDERIYVIVWSGFVLLKRVQFVGSGIVLRSDNDLYDPLPVPFSELPSLHIPGRVGWAWRGGAL